MKTEQLRDELARAIAKVNVEFGSPQCGWDGIDELKCAEAVIDHLASMMREVVHVLELHHKIASDLHDKSYIGTDTFNDTEKALASIPEEWRKL